MTWTPSSRIGRKPRSQVTTGTSCMQPVAAIHRSFTPNVRPLRPPAALSRAHVSATSCLERSGPCERAVEREVLSGDRVPGVGGGGGCAGGGCKAIAGLLVGEQACERGVEGGGVAGRDELRGAGGGDLGEAADLGQQQRLAEAERGEEDARLVDLAVGQHDEVGAAEEGGDLVVGDE